MPARVTSTQFVGREHELARLAAALETARSGRATTVLIAGTAGIGVSRLLAECQRRLGGVTEPFTVIRCRRTVPGWGEPYAPIIAGLLPVLHELADADLAHVVGPGAEPIGRQFPPLCDRFVRLGLLPARPWVVPHERRQPRLLEAFLGVLERLGDRAPVLLAIEDLHAADHATRALASFLGRISRPGRVCLVATYEPDEMVRDHPLRADLAAIEEAARPLDRMVLGPLGRDELAEMIADIEGERPSGALLLLVAERSGGNPLVAEEILAARRELSGVSPAGSFEQLVTARFAQRSPECRRLLRFLAVAGAALTVDELSAASAAFEAGADGLPPRSTSGPRTGSAGLDADLSAGLAEAIEHGWVRERPAPDPPAPADRPAAPQLIGLRHGLVARAIVADLLPGQLGRLHLALGQALDRRPSARVRHFLAAHDGAAARRAALDAADHAHALDAPADELAALEHAISLDGPHRGAEARRASSRLLARAAEAAFAADRINRAAAFAEAAIAGLGERVDGLELGLLHDRLARFRRAAGDQGASLDGHREAVRLVPRAPSRERALVLAGLAQALMLDGRFAAAERVAGEAITVARTVGKEARPEEGHAICSLGIIRAWGTGPEDAPALLAEARGIAEELHLIDDLFRASANATTALALLGRRDESIAVAREGIDLAKSAGLEAVYGNFLRGNVANILFLAGRWDEAREMSRTALEWSPSGPVVLDAEASLATVEIESAADEAAARTLGHLLLALETRPDPQDVGPASRAAASFALWRGDLSDARRTAELGWSHAISTEDWYLIGVMAATLLEVLATVAADAKEGRDLATLAGARSQAASVLEAAEQALRGGSPGTPKDTRRWAEASLATARAYWGRLDGHDAPTAWDAVARMWEQVGDPYQVARARWRQAQAALTTNDARTGRRLARAPLRQALRIARELGARPLLRELAELAERALITLPPGEAPERSELAVRESVPVAVGPGLEPANGATAPGGDGLVSAIVGGSGPRRPDAFGLSNREKEVLALVAQGRTNREIGEHLFISEKTVGVHVGNVLAKMRVAGRVEAATVAIRLGLTDPTPPPIARSRAGSRAR